MIVKCVRTKIQEFPFNFKAHLDYYRGWLRGWVENGFDDLIVGKEYIVYAIKESQGYPFYFIKNSDQSCPDYHLQPAPCFEIIDATISKNWHYQSDVHTRETGEEIFRSTLAIREWVDRPDFLYRLIDKKSPELEIWAEAARNIEEEAIKARPTSWQPSIITTNEEGEKNWQRVEIEADDIIDPDHKGENIIRAETDELRIHLYEDRRTGKRRHGKIVHRY